MVEDDAVATDVAEKLTLQNAPAIEPGRQLNLPTAALSVVAAAALAACGGGGGGGSGSATPAATVVAGRSDVVLSSVSSVPLASDNDAARFLMQAQFSASTAEIADLRAAGRGGVRGWLERQIAMPHALAWEWLNSRGFADVGASFQDYADHMAWSQLITSPDTLRRRVALALSEILVVSLNGVNTDWRCHAVAHYWDTLCKHALGNYRDLLKDITLNLAMGYYLNTKGNLGEKTKTVNGIVETIRQPDENYAREVMQLFSIGLVMLSPNGRVLTNSAGQAIDSYTSEDVRNLARVFTGYDLDKAEGSSSEAHTRRPMVQTEGNRSKLEVRLFENNPDLGNANLKVIGAGLSGAQRLDAAIDALVSHPNAAPFISKQLIQKLVTSNPSETYVENVANVFANTKGDLARVIAAVLTDPEARDLSVAQARKPLEYGKLREPMLRLVQWARTFKVTSKSGNWPIGDATNPTATYQLGQSPLRSPSVFNFFRPGYVPRTETPLSPGTVVPEFQLVNETSVANYLNYIMVAITNGIPEGGWGGNDMRANYDTEVSLAGSPTLRDPSALIARLNLLLCAGQLSVDNVQTITRAVGEMAPLDKPMQTALPVPTNAERLNRVRAAVLMVMASANYLIQK